MPCMFESFLRRRQIRIRCFVALTALMSGLALLAADQADKGLPKKTGVAAPGIQRPMAGWKPLAELPVEGHPDWLAVTEDALWVASSNVNHVVRLDAKTNKPTVVVTVAKPCSGLAVAAGSLWIPSCGGHNLVRADALTGAKQATIPTGPADSEGGIAAGAGSIWLVVSGTSELDRIDEKTNQITARIKLPQGSYNPVFAGDSIWVASNAGNCLVRVDAASNTVLSATPTGPKPRFLTAGAGSVWTLNQGDGTISRIDQKTGKLQATISAGIPGLGGEIAYGGGFVWSTVFGYPVTRIDPASNQVVQQWTGEGGDSIRFAHGSVWLTFLTGAKVWRLSAPPL